MYAPHLPCTSTQTPPAAACSCWRLPAAPLLQIKATATVSDLESRQREPVVGRVPQDTRHLLHPGLMGVQDLLYLGGADCRHAADLDLSLQIWGPLHLEMGLLSMSLA